CIVYNKRPKKQAVNFFGDLPCPINNITGPGTPHPIGLNKNELIELTHNIQIFRVNINAIPLGTDALTQFLAGGGATGGLIGAINALSSITVPVPIVFNSPALAEGSEIYERVCGQNFVARRNGRVSINTGRYVYKN